MKRTFTICALAAFSGICLMSYSTNSTNQTGDMTGSPLSNNTTCYSCHNTGATRPVTIIYATPLGGGGQVTSFVPGQEYTINISSMQPTALYPKFGFQACVLTSDNQNAGTITAATTGSQLVTKNGVSYLEHASPLTTTTGSSARIQFNWTAPNTDKPVTIYGMITQVNNYQNVNGDIPSHAGKFTLSSTVGIANINGRTSDVYIYPSPATDHISVALPDITAGDVSINIFDFSGRRVLSSHLELSQNNTVHVSTTGLDKGIYFLSINAGKYNSKKTFVIQ